jgi:L-ascorbate metabolism protein UlaG (beta-lactamase superfamily)
LQEELLFAKPDVVAFTHMHKDHYDPAYAAAYAGRTGRVILGPGQLKGSMERVVLDDITVIPVPCRHIGAAGREVEHCGFVVQGSQCLWFTGDSTPTAWRGKDLPKPDVLVVPYAYANTYESWRLTQSFGAEKIVLLHMPAREEDTMGLWPAVETATTGSDRLYPLKMGEYLQF